MGKLTTHVLNVAAGVPAVGMRIDLHYRPAPGAPPGVPSDLLCTARTDADGRCAAAFLEGSALRVGRYSLTFHTAAYFRSLGVVLPEPPFLDDVVVAFGIADPSANYHVPLLVSPWSYATYRGS